MHAIRRIQLLIAIVAVAALAPAAFGQDHRFEITPHYGFRFGGGIDVSPDTLPIASLNFNRFTVESSGAGGIGGGIYVSENFLVGFDWTKQSSKVDGRLFGGSVEEDLADFTMNTFHFIGTYHFMEADSKLRPFFTFGMGWTGSRPEISGVETFNRFSTGIGGGVKYFFKPNIGAFTQFRYMPTFVYSEPGGIWCDWYGFCWVVSDNNYLHQGDLQFGVSLRF